MPDFSDRLVGSSAGRLATTRRRGSRHTRRDTLSRRRLLKLGAVALAGFGVGQVPCLAGADSRSVPPPRGRSRGARLVIVGASFAGISLARAVKRIVPTVEILLLERAPCFVF